VDKRNPLKVINFREYKEKKLEELKDETRQKIKAAIARIPKEEK